MNKVDSALTVLERLKASLEAAARHNPNDAEKPAAILWTDPEARWLPVIPQLNRLMPQLLVLGEYEAQVRRGPSIWLRCVIARTLESPKIPSESTPVLYLPGVGRPGFGVRWDLP